MARRNITGERKRGSRGGQSSGRRSMLQPRYATLIERFDDYRGAGKGANVYGGRQEVVLSPTTAMAAAGGGAVTAATITPTAGGVLSTFQCEPVGGAVGDVTVSKLTHNNDNLLVRTVPSELFAFDSRINPLVGRIAVRSDDIEVEVINNNAGALTVHNNFGQEPWLGSSPRGTKGRSLQPQILHAHENNIIAMGSDQGRTAIAAGASQTFTFKASEPMLLQHFCIVSSGALGELEVSSFAIDNRNQIDGGSVTALVFDQKSTANPVFRSFVEPADVIEVVITNNGAGAHNVQPCFTCSSPR
jgi:hypothetical protein